MPPVPTRSTSAHPRSSERSTWRRAASPATATAWLDPHANELAASYFADTLPGLDAGYLRPRYDGALLVQNEGGNMVWESLRSGGDPSELLDRLDAVYRRSLADHAG